MFAQLRKYREKLNEYDSITALLKALPDKALENTGSALILFLVLSPIMRLILSLLFTDVHTLNFTADTLNLGGYWSTYLLQIGYVSLIVSVVVLSKRVVETHRDSVSLKALFKRHFPLILLSGFFLWTIIATIFSTNVSLSFFGTSYRKEGLIMFGAYFGFVGISTQIKSLSKIKFLVFIFLLGSAILSWLSIVDSVFLNRLFTLSQRTSIFHNPNHYGYYLTLVLLSGAGYLLYVKRYDWMYFIVGISFITNTITLIINQSIGPYIGVIGGLGVLSVFTVWHHKLLIKKLCIILIIFVIASFYESVQTQYLSSEASGISQDVSSIVRNTEDASSAGSGRYRLWTLGITYGNNNILSGHGPDNLGSLYRMDDVRNDRAHNEFIQYYATLGIIGVTLYTSMLLSYAYMFLTKNRHHDLLNMILFSVIVGYKVSALFGNTMYYTAPFYFTILSLALTRIYKFDCDSTFEAVTNTAL